MVNVFVIILNWNRKKDTLECIESIGKVNLDNCKLHVIVVDNNSSDDSRIAVKKRLKVMTRDRKSLAYTLIKNKRNLGFAAGNNVGIRSALSGKSDYIMLLNNDTIVDKNIIVDLLRIADQNQDAGQLTPKIYFAPGFEFHKEKYQEKEIGKVIWSAGGNIDWDNVYGTNHGVDEVDVGQFDTVRETDFATGACVLLRSSALRQVGMLDEKFYLYLEDADLSVRMKKAGWKVLYAPTAHIWHKVSQSSGIGSELNDYFISRNRLLFGMRYAPIRTRFALYKESLRLLLKGRKWQKIGIKDYYLGNFGKGSWK